MATNSKQPREATLFTSDEAWTLLRELVLLISFFGWQEDRIPELSEREAKRFLRREKILRTVAGLLKKANEDDLSEESLMVAALLQPELAEIYKRVVAEKLDPEDSRSAIIKMVRRMLKQRGMSRKLRRSDEEISECLVKRRQEIRVGTRNPTGMSGGKIAITGASAMASKALADLLGIGRYRRVNDRRTKEGAGTFRPGYLYREDGPFQTGVSDFPYLEVGNMLMRSFGFEFDQVKGALKCLGAKREVFRLW